VSADQPSTTVTMWAAYDPKWFAFAQTHTEIGSAPDPGAFADPQALVSQKVYCDPGKVAPDGDGVTGIHIIQYHFPLAQHADTHTPLTVWSATWTTDDFTPRTVPIWTISLDYWVYVDDGGYGQDFYGINFSEAQGLIEVVGGCYPDFSGDGLLDILDFLAFV